MKVIIVDDEPPARAELRRMLAAYDDIDIVGEAADLNSARGLLLRVRPDVLFLDINLNGASGFDLLDGADPDVAVIFATAFDEYAVKAFDAAAVDYLLKPIEPGRLADCIARLRSRLKPALAEPSVFNAQRWLFLDGPRPEFIEISSIACIRAVEGGSEIITANGKARVTANTLAKWREKVPADFVLLNRSALINLQHVTQIEPWSNYSYRVFIEGMSTPIVMSRRQAGKLRSDGM